MARLGFFGFPNTGKSTLFNALTGLGVPTAQHPFSTIQPNVGVARVPDPVLDEVARLEGSARTVHATLELLDLPATGGTGGTGIGAQFLGRLREVEALIVVLRAFDDPAVPSDESGLDPVSQAEELLLELAMADAEVFERRRDRIVKEAMADPGKRPAADAITRAVEILSDGGVLRSHAWSPEAHAAFRDSAPLTLKPAVWVINVDDDESAAGARVSAVSAGVPAGDAVVALSARMEEEVAELDPSERAELFAELGLGEGALAQVVQATYDALGLLSFYTLGPKEAHAWTVRRGARAPEAAGKVHSDLQRGFIRAEVAPITAVIAAGGWDAAKRANQVRVEGKDYEIRDADVIVVRFSV